MSARRALLVLVHGWGLDASLWQPVRARLPECETVAFDLGFRGPAVSPVLPEAPLVIAVGHSLGLAWLLRNRPLRWDALVAVNGFTRFTADPTFPDGVPARQLERMIAKLGRDPAGVTADFLTRCGQRGTAPAGALDGASLAQGLGWLRDWDTRAAFVADAAPVLALAGGADPIVPPAMSRACFAARPNCRLAWRDGGGHLLPAEDPDWCAGHVRAFVAERLEAMP